MADAPENDMKLADALRFLVRLGQTKISAVSRGGLLDLVDGLRKYANIPSSGKTDKELRQAQKRPEILSEAIKIAHAIIETVADHKKLRPHYDAGEYLIDATKGGPPRAFENCSLRDAVLHAAVSDIDEEQARRIRRCPRCETIFYGQTNAKFCSRRCASAEAVTRYRAGGTKPKKKHGSDEHKADPAVGQKRLEETVE